MKASSQGHLGRKEFESNLLDYKSPPPFLPNEQRKNHLYINVVMVYVVVVVGFGLFGIDMKQVLGPICVAMHFIFRIGHVLGKQDYIHYECQNYLMY